jgi:hypothetical protein
MGAQSAPTLTALINIQQKVLCLTIEEKTPYILLINPKVRVQERLHKEKVVWNYQKRDSLRA